MLRWAAFTMELCGCPQVFPQVFLLWDNQYQGYTKLSPVDETRNCFAHALGHSLWINDPAWVLADCYANNNTQPEVDLVRAGHMLKIDVVWTGHEQSANGIHESSEKNRCSGIYHFSHPVPSGKPFTNPYKKK